MNTSLQNSKDDFRKQIIQMCRYLGIDADRNIELDILEFQGLSNIGRDRIIYFMEINNPFIKELELEQAKAKKTLYNAKLSNSFNATINISYGLNQYDEYFERSYSNLNSRQSASISLQIPIFNWGIDKNNYEIAENTYESQAISINKEKTKLYDNVKITYNSYVNSLSLYYLARDKKQLATDIYSTAIQKMILGKLSMYELSQVSNDYEAKIIEYYQSINNVWVNYYTLRAIALYDFHTEQSLIDILIN